MKVYKQKLNINYLIEGFLNVGRPSRERNRENVDNLLVTPSKYDQIDLTKSCRALRKSLLSTSNIVSRGGRVLIFSKLGENGIGNNQLKTFFTKVWPQGLISNFKNMGKEVKHVPNFVVVSTNDAAQQSAIANELNRCKVGSTFITNSNNSKYGVINIPGNNASSRTGDLLISLFKRAVTIGLLKEVAKLQAKQATKISKRTNWRQKFPRLGSNQRPRT
jgi:ribosomal protein S2